MWAPYLEVSSLHWNDSIFTASLYRLQVAKEEVEEKFRHTALGEGVKKKYPKVVLAKINHKLSPREKTRKYQSKVQRSKADAVEAFGGVASFDKLPIQKKSEM